MSTPDPRTERAQLDKWLLQTNRYPGTVTAGEAAQHLYDAAAKANDALTTEAARVRGECASFVRAQAGEMTSEQCEGCGNSDDIAAAAVNDHCRWLADQLQADHINDAVKKVSQWSTARPTSLGHYMWRASPGSPQQTVEVTGVAKVGNNIQVYTLQQIGWVSGGEWCPIERPSEEVG